MNLRMKRNVTKVFAATLVLTGVLTAVNASAADKDVPNVSETRELQKGGTVTVSATAEKVSASGSDGKITFNSNIPANDTVIVNIRNSNDNIVSTGNCRCRNLSSGTTKTIEYRDGKGKKGNKFHPVFSLDPGSMSSKLTIKYKFVP